jgi:hypothetical protein
MKISGIEGLSTSEIEDEIANGAQFVIYQYTISIVVASFKNNSAIYFIKSGRSRALAGWHFSLLTFLLGWWGLPWGPIYTIQCLYNNLRGGKDVTQEVADQLLPPEYAARVRPPSFPMPPG